MPTIALEHHAPLRWEPLAAFLAARAIAGREAFVDGRYERVVNGATVTVDRDLRMTVPSALADESADFVRRARRTFDLDLDPAPVFTHLRKDPLLRPLVKRGTRIPGAWDPFETAVRAIVGQQISVAGATTIMQRLAGVLTPELVAVAEITGMPRKRADAIRNLARLVAGDRSLLDPEPTLDDSIAKLTALPGIGPWTAHYVAMRALGQRDAFPHTDLGLRKAAAAIGIEPDRLLEHAERWRPWRSYAAITLWESLAG